MSRIESVADRGANRPACPAARRDFVGRAVRWLRFVGLLEEPCEVRHPSHRGGSGLPGVDAYVSRVVQVDDP